MKPLLKNLLKPFRSTFLTLLFTVPQVPIVGSLSGQKALAQTPTCPAGTRLVNLNGTDLNFQTANFNQTFNIGGVNINFRMVENPPGIITDINPGPLGAVPYGIADGPYGGINKPYLRWGINARVPNRGGNATLTITSDQPIILPSSLLFLDVDRDRADEAGYQDQITVTASNAGVNVPVTFARANINVPSVTEVAGNVARGQNPRVEPGNAPPESSAGNVAATFSGPVTSIQIIYESGPLYTSPNPEPGQDETIGIATDISICVPTATGSLQLVKRITAIARINGQRIPYSTFVDDPNDQNDNVLRPAPVGQYEIETPVESGDEVEYTIYFRAGQLLENLNFCDLIPAGTTYVPNSISVNGGGSGADRGRFFSPLTSLEQIPESNVCENRNNPNGTVIIRLGNVPSGQSGSVSFRVRIN